jgi:hypothetical protein
MKTSIRLIALVAVLLAAQLCIAQAPAGAPAGTTAVCNDGTYSTATGKRGACSGHKGVKEWYGAASTKSAKPTAAAATESNTAPPSTPSSNAKANTAAGGPGQVWVNTASNVYHCPGDRYYGKTKAGAYMTEAEAKAKGARPDHGKACK